MKIHKNFVGGNISVTRTDGNDVYLKNELRDTMEDWFYWAFCVEEAEGETVTFHLDPERMGYYGPAVSHDLKQWVFLDQRQGDAFRYSFGKEETKVYFAFSMLYHPEMFFEFAKENGLEIRKFCKSPKGRSVPSVSFGEGAKSIILTARHHACESTGNYVLQGVVEALFREPIQNHKVLCVPFIDYDGVLEGDQGKSRAPHDHNRDYSLTEKELYPTTAALKRYADRYGCHYGFDFHAPGHCYGVNDTVFIVQSSLEKLDKLNRFGELLEDSMTGESLQYYHKNDYPPCYGWNQPSTQFSTFMCNRPENELAFSLETAYFGLPENRVSAENLIELGRCFAKALKKYIDNEGEPL